MPPLGRRGRCRASQVLALLALATPVLGALTPESGAYALVADAGSTGTRVYVYHLGAGSEVQITDVGKGPALSSFQDTPEKAAEAVKAQLFKAQALIPPELRPAVPVSVFATAGLRLLPEETQQAIFEGLKKGLLSESYPFDADALEVRTISGREEGVFALLAANYLEKTLRATLEVTGRDLMGVLDLGGSSTQVAVPPSLTDGESLALKLGSEHTFVRSYLNLGMERMRHRTYQRLMETAAADVREQKTVPNPCAFTDYAEDGGEWRGVGRAVECQAVLAEVIREEKAACAEAAANGSGGECLDETPAPAPTGAEGAKFFLISGYLYVTEFARWWLTGAHSAEEKFKAPGLFESPTVAELREAAAALCAQPWARIASVALDPRTRSRFTPPDKVAHRCFELNYIAALLSVGYGFPDGDRLFRIVEEVAGNEIEWTLGAFLHGFSKRRGSAPSNEL